MSEGNKKIESNRYYMLAEGIINFIRVTDSFIVLISQLSFTNPRTVQ